MLVRLLTVGITLSLVALAAPAQDKKDPKEKSDKTAWVREDSGVDLTMEFGKNTLKLSAFNGDNGCILTCKTKTDKDGVISATVTEAVEKGNFPATPKVGFEFSFKWNAKDDTAMLSDLKGEGLEDARGIIEGDYKKKK